MYRCDPTVGTTEELIDKYATDAGLAKRDTWKITLQQIRDLPQVTKG